VAKYYQVIPVYADFPSLAAELIERLVNGPKKLLNTISLLCILTVSEHAVSGNVLSCVPTFNAPTIDGHASDTTWNFASQLTIKDAVTELNHKLACVYDNSRIYIKASYADTTESRTHKTGVWNQEEGTYKYSTDREDTLVLKWNMDDNKGDLSLSSDVPYRADIWYWKAHRTDPMGYADDKSHVYSYERLKKSKKSISKRGNRFFLVRRGDRGQSAYKPIIHVTHFYDEVQSYSHRNPTGSRADIKAKGRWFNNKWTIEFSRALDTGNADDVRFRTNRQYQFGVSRYEIAGTREIKNSNNPQHGAGDIDQTITLIFQEYMASH